MPAVSHRPHHPFLTIPPSSGSGGPGGPEPILALTPSAARPTPSPTPATSDNVFPQAGRISWMLATSLAGTRIVSRGAKGAVDHRESVSGSGAHSTTALPHPPPPSPLRAGARADDLVAGRYELPPDQRAPRER